MSETTTTTTEAPEGDVQPMNEPPATVSVQEPQTFDAEYVGKLRDEAATHRVRAQRADVLAEGWYRSAVELATAGILMDPTDLPRSDDHFDPDGRPNVEAIRASAEELAASKPHLARARMTSAQLQGPTGQPPVAVGLGSLLRDAAR